MIMLISLTGIVLTIILLIGLLLTSNTQEFFNVILAINTIMVSYLMAYHLFLWYAAIKLIKNGDTINELESYENDEKNEK